MNTHIHTHLHNLAEWKWFEFGLLILFDVEEEGGWVVLKEGGSKEILSQT